MIAPDGLEIDELPERPQLNPAHYGPATSPLPWWTPSWSLLTSTSRAASRASRCWSPRRPAASAASRPLFTRHWPPHAPSSRRGLLHVLLLGTPRPLSFFAWITALADVTLVAAPFSQPASLSSKVFTAVINLVTGVTVISRLPGVARSAERARPARPVMSSGMQPK
jgi:hypothetical protein